MNQHQNPSGAWKMGYNDALNGRKAVYVGSQADKESYVGGYSAGGEQYFFEQGLADGGEKRWNPPINQKPGAPLFEAYKSGYETTKDDRDGGNGHGPHPLVTHGQVASRGDYDANVANTSQRTSPQTSGWNAENRPFRRPKARTHDRSQSIRQRGDGSMDDNHYRMDADRARQLTASGYTAHRFQSGLANILFFIGDAARLVKQSEAWAESLPDSRGTLYAYAAATATMSVATFGMAALFDLFPSLDFAWYMGKWFQANVFSGYDWLTALPMDRLIVLLVLAIAASPSLLEFFGSRLAQLNISVSLALRGAVLFDAVTDAPAAYHLAEAIARYIPFSEFAPANMAMILTKLTAIGLSVPVLLAATLIIEILFVSFASACWKVLERISKLPQIRRTPTTNTTHR
jgi:hypothetical protein